MRNQDGSNARVATLGESYKDRDMAGPYKQAFRHFAGGLDISRTDDPRNDWCSGNSRMASIPATSIIPSPVQMSLQAPPFLATLYLVYLFVCLGTDG